MTYGQTPLSTTPLGTNQFPASSVYPPNTGGSNPTHDFKALGGGPIRTDDDGNTYSEALLYVKDGDNETLGAKANAAITDATQTATQMSFTKGLVKILADIWDSVNHRIKVDGSGVTQPVSAASLPLPTGAAQETGGNLANTATVLGGTTDAAVVGDNPGSISAKQRGLSKILNDVWDSVNHRLHVAVDNANPNGQTTMAGSSPVVIASDQIVPVKGNTFEIIGQGTGVVNGVNTDLIPATDISNYKSFALQLTGTWVATLTFQGSNTGNPNDFINFNVFSIGSAASASPTQSTNGVYYGPVLYKYLRVRATAFTSNTSLVGTLELFTLAPQLLTNYALAAQNGTWTVQPGNTQNTTPWLTMPNGCSYAEIAAGAAGPSVIKASAGILYGILAITSAAGAPIAYDNASAASGNPIGALAANAAIGTMSQTPQVGVKAANGITVSGGATMPQMVVFYS